MYTNVDEWRQIRHAVLIDKMSKSSVVRMYGISWKTLTRMLANRFPPPYKRRKKKNTARTTLSKPTSLNKDELLCQDVLALLDSPSLIGTRALLNVVSAIKSNRPSRDELIALRDKLKAQQFGGTQLPEHFLSDREPHRWMLQVMQGDLSVSQVREAVGDIPELEMLVQKARHGNLKERNRAIAILSRLRKISLRTISRFLFSSIGAIVTHWQTFQAHGVKALLKAYTTSKPRKAEDQQVRNAIFTVLHTPPSKFDINRTTWKLTDLQISIARNGGPHISKDVIREVVKSAGYRWRQAKTVLTSNDPLYRQKLDRIHEILSHLKEDERFFSIDEFGPFAVKAKGGRRLVAPDEYPSVPQRQKSKGCLILTAALELSRNQVTHFYSTKKNTAEMVKLLYVLLTQYRQCSRIFLSWDAASWHASHLLYDTVDKVNSSSFRSEHGTPFVELAPLPSCAQFLNVIESVFSGMAKAIIHSSDYESVEAAVAAIDRYYRERNEHFLSHPKRAGKKIWGQELTKPAFDESQNCKDPKWAIWHG